MSGINDFTNLQNQMTIANLALQNQLKHEQIMAGLESQRLATESQNMLNQALAESREQAASSAGIVSNLRGDLGQSELIRQKLEEALRQWMMTQNAWKELAYRYAGLAGRTRDEVLEAFDAAVNAARAAAQSGTKGTGSD